MIVASEGPNMSNQGTAGKWKTCNFNNFIEAGNN
jgi:hypothetical protein